MFKKVPNSPWKCKGQDWVLACQKKPVKPQQQHGKMGDLWALPLCFLWRQRGEMGPNSSQDWGGIQASQLCPVLEDHRLQQHVEWRCREPLSSLFKMRIRAWFPKQNICHTSDQEQQKLAQWAHFPVPSPWYISYSEDKYKWEVLDH